MLGWFGSSAAEKALADSFQLAGGPVPRRGLVLGRVVRMRTVRLGGPIVRSARRNAADIGEVDDVSLYRDSSAALVLDLRRKLKAVLNLLDSLVRCGASLTRDVELSHLWDCIVRLGPLGSVSIEDYVAARTCGVGESRRLVTGLYDRVGLLLIVVIWVLLLGVVGFGKILWFILTGGFVPIDFRFLPSCSVIGLLLLGVLVFLLTLLVLMKNSVRLGFPTFVALGRRPALMNSIVSVMGGCRGWMSSPCRL